MATLESIRMREEKAIERIDDAIGALAAERQTAIPKLNFDLRIPPLEQQAYTLESLADMLDALVQVSLTPVYLDDVDQGRRGKRSAMGAEHDKEQDKEQDKEENVTTDPAQAIQEQRDAIDNNPPASGGVPRRQTKTPGSRS